MSKNENYIISQIPCCLQYTMVNLSKAQFYIIDRTKPT